MYKRKAARKGFLKTSHCVTSALSPAPVEQVKCALSLKDTVQRTSEKGGTGKMMFYLLSLIDIYRYLYILVKTLRLGINGIS